MSGKKQNLAKCPECGSVIQLDEFDEIGDVVSCHDCNSELELVKVNPPKFRCIRESSSDDDNVYDEYLDDFSNLREDLMDEWN